MHQKVRPFASHVRRSTDPRACAVAAGDSIASEGKGDYMYVEGKVLSTDGHPIPDAIIETWETDGDGAYSDMAGRALFAAGVFLTARLRTGRVLRHAVRGT